MPRTFPGGAAPRSAALWQCVWSYDMDQGRIRAQIEAHWCALDALVDSQSGGNEVIIRALDVFAGARGAFTADREPATAATDAALALSAPNLFDSQHDDTRVALLGSLPRGITNADDTDDVARRAYFRAEEALVLAREQLARSEATLQLMREEIERARVCIRSSYNTDEVVSREARKVVRARASLQALSRGDSGCAMSPVDMVRAMAGLLRMHQSELEMQETVVFDLGYDTPGETITAYREALGLRPFLDDRYLSEIHEIRELSRELESPGARFGGKEA